MAKTKEEKQNIVDNYIEKINSASALLIITPKQITPNEANTLRRTLQESDASFNVIKNSLFKIAIEKTKKPLQDIEFVGENAVVFIKGDISEITKKISNFLEEIKKGDIKGGVLDNVPLGKEEIEELAKLPPKEVMLAITVATIGAPLYGFVNVLNATMTNFVTLLKNLNSEKQT